MKALIVAWAIPVVLTASILAGCDGAKTITIEGIVQTVDPGSNTLTMSLGAGDTVTLRLGSSTTVKIGDREVNSSYLEPGLSVTTLARGKAAELIEIDLARLEATIVSADSSQIVVQALNSPQRLGLKTKSFSLVRRNGVDVDLANLNPGRIAQVSFCTASGTAYEVYEMPEGYTAPEIQTGAPLEGVVTKYRLNEVTVTPVGGVDRKVLIDAATKISFQDGSPATKNDILYWDWVTVNFNSSTGVASRIVIRPDSSIRSRK